MIVLICEHNAKALAEKLNELGPSQILAVYSVNQLHHAWIQVNDKKGEKKERK